MRQTLFYVPHEFLGIPVLGFGWVLGMLVVFAVTILLSSRGKQSMAKTLEDQGIMWLVAAAIIIFLLPQIEQRLDDGTPQGAIVGLPIRGYGVMLMMAVMSALGIALVRCKRIGITQESFFSLATWVVVLGLLGARVFYVVQKWNELAGDNIGQKIWTALKVTEGGLVVYGSVIGGLVAILIWSRRNRIAILPIADAVTPAFFIGLAFGRIGCLLNGCCYGGICELPLPSIEFPSGAPAYMDQLKSGKLLGMQTSKEPKEGEPQKIHDVAPNSWAQDNKIEQGQNLVSVDEIWVKGPTLQEPLAHPVFEAAVRVDNRRLRAASIEIPSRSLPVHPSQVYAAISGLILCGWTFLLSEKTRRTGVVFGAGLVSYGVLRIIEEIIRVDESGQFGTSLSIAQWISLGAILAGVLLLVWANVSKQDSIVQQPQAS